MLDIHGDCIAKQSNFDSDEMKQFRNWRYTYIECRSDDLHSIYLIHF